MSQLDQIIHVLIDNKTYKNSSSLHLMSFLSTMFDDVRILSVTCSSYQRQLRSYKKELFLGYMNICIHKLSFAQIFFSELEGYSVYIYFPC